MAKKRSKVLEARRLILFFPVCILILCAVFASIASYWVKISQKYQEKISMEEEIVSLKEKEEILKGDVERLEDPDYIARYAREKYMYSKEGEIILRLPEEDE